MGILRANLLRQFPDLLIDDAQAAYRSGRYALTSLDISIAKLTDVYAYKLMALGKSLNKPKKDTRLDDQEVYLKTFAGEVDGDNYTFAYQVDEDSSESEEDEASIEAEKVFLRRYYHN